MKNSYPIKAFALLLLAFTFSCSDSNNSRNDCGDSQLSFMLNNVLWEADSFENSLFAAQDPTTGTDARRADIRATNSEGDQLIITMNNPNHADDDCIDTGAYVAIPNVSAFDQNVFFFTYIRNSGISISVVDGELNITSCTEGSREVTGTFSFSRSAGDFDGTNGSFKVCF